MPTLPRATDITRVIPSGQQQVSRLDVSDVGRGLQAVAGAADDYHVRRTNYQMAQAKTEFLKAKVRQDNAYADDENYLTIPDRYENGMRDALSKSAELIDDPRAKAAFYNEAELDVMLGHERIKEYARGIERDYQRGFITEGLAGIREAGLTGSVPNALDSAEDLIESAIAMDYLSAEEGAKMAQSWRNEMLSARLNMMDPSERLDALSEPWAQNIPADVRDKLHDEARKDLVERRAIETVDSLMALPEAEAQERVAEIEDPDLRVETERRLDVQLSRRQRTEVSQQEELHRAYFNPVRLEGLSVDDIPEDELDRMSPTLVNSLLVAERNYAQGRQPITPPDVLDRLNVLYRGGAGSPVEVREYFQDVAHLLSRSDFETWSKTTAESFGDMETDPVFTGTQMIGDAIREVNQGEDDPALMAQYRRDFERWVFEYRSTHEGQDPTGEEQRNKIDQMLLTIPTRESRMPFNVAPAAYTRWDELAPEERGDALAYLKSLDPEAYAAAEQTASQGGTVQPNPRDIAYLFSIISDADDR